MEPYLIRSAVNGELTALRVKQRELTLDEAEQTLEKVDLGDCLPVS